jgi:D-serine deaminase-like pyridoxal phosphate-dependent protein
MDGTIARSPGATPGRTEPQQAGLQEAPGLRLAGTQAYERIDPADERLGALRSACCLLERLKAEAAALDVRCQSGRGDPMKVVTGRTSLEVAAERLEALIRELDEAVMADLETGVGASR